MDVKLKSPTRRGILSVVSSVYDSLGLAALFVLPAKQLLQGLCPGKLEWDESIRFAWRDGWQTSPNYRSFLSNAVLNRLVSTLSRPVICTIFWTPPKSDSDQILIFLSLCNVTSTTFENAHDPMLRVVRYSDLCQARQGFHERTGDTS